MSFSWVLERAYELVGGTGCVCVARESHCSVREALMSVCRATSDVMYLVVLVRMSLGSDLNIITHPPRAALNRLALTRIARPCFTLTMRSRRAGLGKMRWLCAHAPSELLHTCMSSIRTILISRYQYQGTSDLVHINPRNHIQQSCRQSHSLPNRTSPRPPRTLSPAVCQRLLSSSAHHLAIPHSSLSRAS